MSESDNDEQTKQLNIQTTSVGLVKKKATSGRLKEAKRVSKVAGAKKMKKEPKLAAYDGDYNKAEEEGNACGILESGCDKQTMMKLQASSAPMGNKVAVQSYFLDSYTREDGATVDNMDPSRPFLYLDEYDPQKVKEWEDLRSAFLGDYVQNDITFPDPTPKLVWKSFYDISSRLTPILKKDSVRCFLRLFAKSGRGMFWFNRITSQTLTYMISYDALRCAKVVLEGKAPELENCCANPNCMNPYGYFPIHEAAERFSVDMIKLLFKYGASANVCTAGDSIIEGLLPLHVAVENTCMHKYLEDNLFPTQDHKDYVYRLIHLLCLPEMKIFLDTTRLLAKETNNLVDEIWNYMKGGKLLEAAIILLAAQGQIRGSCLSKSQVNGNWQNGFDVIMHRVVTHFIDGKQMKDESGKAHEHLVEMRILCDCAFLLVDIISQAGEDLDSYIQADSEVPPVEVFKRVSSILMDCGFCPTGQSIEVENLRPYDCEIFDREIHHKVTKTTHLHAVKEKAVRKPAGWDGTYIRRSYLPYWRSVLGARCLVRFTPSYAEVDRFMPDIEQLRNGCSPIPNRNLGLLERIRQLTTNYQQRKFFGTAAVGSYQQRKFFGTAALMLLSRKMPGGKRCYW